MIKIKNSNIDLREKQKLYDQNNSVSLTPLFS